MNINPGKNKKLSFTKARLKDGLGYYFKEQLILEAGSFKYLRIIIRSDLNRTDHVTHYEKYGRHFIL
jgi:hypothetical protein